MFFRQLRDGRRFMIHSHTGNLVTFKIKSCCSSESEHEWRFWLNIIEKPADNYIKKELSYNCMSTTELKQVMIELKTIQKELADIKWTMPDKDMFLSNDEAKLLQESFLNEQKGTLISSKNLRKKLGI